MDSLTHIPCTSHQWWCTTNHSENQSSLCLPYSPSIPFIQQHNLPFPSLLSFNHVFSIFAFPLSSLLIEALLQYCLFLTSCSLSLNNYLFDYLFHQTLSNLSSYMGALRGKLKGNSGIFKPRPYFWHEIRLSTHREQFGESRRPSKAIQKTRGRRISI